MSGLDIPRAQALLRAGETPGAVAEQLGTTLRTLQRAFGAAGLPSPRAWQHAELGSQSDPEGWAQPVSFRLPEFPELAAAAAAAGKRPGEYARNIVQAHLRSLRRGR